MASSSRPVVGSRILLLEVEDRAFAPLLHRRFLVTGVANRPANHPWHWLILTGDGATFEVKCKVRVLPEAQPRPCGYCADSFSPKQAGQKYCSPECGNRANRLQERVRKQRAKELV